MKYEERMEAKIDVKMKETEARFEAKLKALDEKLESTKVGDMPESVVKMEEKCKALEDRLGELQKNFSEAALLTPRANSVMSGASGRSKSTNAGAREAKPEIIWLKGFGEWVPKVQILKEAREAAGSDLERRFPNTQFSASHPDNQVRLKFSSATYAKSFLDEMINGDRPSHKKRDGTNKELSWGPDKELHTIQKHIAVNKAKRFIHESFEKAGKQGDIAGNIWKGIILIDMEEVVKITSEIGDIIPTIQIKNKELLEKHGIKDQELVEYVRAAMKRG